MNRLLIFFFALIFFGCDIASNTPAPDKNYFVKYFGGDGNQSAVDMVVDSDGMIYILGNSLTSLNSKQQVYLAKANPLGQVLVDTLLTSSSVYSDAKDLEFTKDGELIVVANQLDTINGDMNVLVKKISKLNLNQIGSNILWTRTPQSQDPLSNPHKNDYVSSITLLADGNYILTGCTEASALGNRFDVMNLQIDANLNKVAFAWGETSGSGAENYGRKTIEVIQSNPTPDTARYIFGNTNADGTDQNVWYADLPLSGNSGESTDDQSDAVFVSRLANDSVTSVIKYDGGYLISSISNPLTSGASTLKLYELGFNFLNPKNSSEVTAYYEWPLGNIANANVAVCKASIGYHVVVDYPRTASNNDILLLRLNGALQNPIYFGGEGDDRMAAVAELPDGHILILGTMQLGNPPEQFKIALIKVNSNGRFDD